MAKARTIGAMVLKALNMTRLTVTLAQELQKMRDAVFMPGAGGALYHAVLPMNRCLSIGDYIVSNNGMFFAIIEADGKLRVYRGAGLERHHGRLWESGRGAPGSRFFALVQTDGNFCIYRGRNLADNAGWVWGTQFTAEGGQFFAHLRDDGSFDICKGSGLDDHQGVIWSSGVSDPVVRIDEVHAIGYSLGSARIVQSRPADLYRETVNNSSAQPQTSMISGSVTVSDSAAWSDVLDLDSAAPAGFKGAVPVVAGTRVQLSPDSHHLYLRNGAATTAKTWGFNAPATVPAESSMMCLVTATRSTVVVPYTLRGVFSLRSGVRVHGSVNGTYTGSNSHDLSVTLTTYDPCPEYCSTVSRPLTPMPSIVGPTVVEHDPRATF
jgi:hypothetical protein